jgi:hypothetical protein
MKVLSDTESVALVIFHTRICAHSCHLISHIV